MKKEYNVFLAIPFDALTKCAYEEICSDLRSFFAGVDFELTTTLGSEQVGPSQNYSEIKSFKALNTDLHQRFYDAIRKADIIVADLTNNNPNVHVELGVALSLGKNILRVSGRSTKELGFDIQNLEVYVYKNKSDLYERIKGYVETFIKIKNLGFSPEHQELYFCGKNRASIRLPEPSLRLANNQQPWLYPIRSVEFRDGAIKFAASFLNSLNHNSWLGVFFRSAEHFNFGSGLLYVRMNGSIELAEYTDRFNVRVLRKLEVPLSAINLLLEINNDHLYIKINSQSIVVEGLEHQKMGRVVLATYECRAEFSEVEIINRDSMTF